MIRFAALCLISILLAGTATAQKRTYSSTSSKAIKSLESAMKYYDSRQTNKAISEAENATRTDPNFIEAWMLLGDLQADNNNLPAAIDAYKKAIGINAGFFPNTYYALARYEMELGRYDDVTEHLNAFMKLPNAQPEKKEQAKMLLASCDFAREALKHPVPFAPENLGDGVNSVFDEYFPSITVDSKQMLFTRKIKSDQFGWQEDFYISNSDNNGKWMKAKNVGSPVNTELNEGAPSFSADGQLIFFTACDRPEGKGSCDIYYSRKFGDTWGRPINLGSPVNTGAWESQPSFSSDGKTLYFVRGSGMRDEKDQDIYMTQVSEKGWSTPVKLSDKINSPGKEEAVFIHPDNQTLYFVSDGWPGMGGTDIYMSRRQPDGSWGDAINLGYPINTFANETGLIVSPDGNTAYFSSNRDGGFGGLDIYSFNLYDKVKPVPVSYAKGLVTDAETNQPIDAKFEVIDLESGQTVVESYSDKSKGEFLLTLPAGKNYALNVSKRKYLFYSDHFSMTETADVQHPVALNVKLQPVKDGSTMNLNNIFFDTNSATLKPESKTELDKLVAFIKSNALAKIEVGGHTDNVGDDKSNQTLSENRAKAVYDYLLKSGIEAIHLTWKGYGESKPIADNTTESGKAKNRRTEITILKVH
ncbi:MAG: PD40 domain-containing protein [Bacteroidetes bacterium]|nr:PD40 domain-containing protein [Bacteroidota bacterium]